MEAAARPVSEGQMETILGRLLQAGVSLAAILVLCGGAVYLNRHGKELPDYHKFHGEAANLRTVGSVLAAAASLQGQGIIQLGLLVLIATPVARVIFSVYGFARQRDWIYLVVTLIVLSLLLYGLFGG